MSPLEVLNDSFMSALLGARSYTGRLERKLR